MELNKEYKVSEYPLEQLEQGTVIRGLTYNVSRGEDDSPDIIIITESNGIWETQFMGPDIILGVSVSNGEFYVVGNNLITYEILRFKK